VAFGRLTPRRKKEGSLLRLHACYEFDRPSVRGAQIGALPLASALIVEALDAQATKLDTGERR